MVGLSRIDAAHAAFDITIMLTEDALTAETRFVLQFELKNTGLIGQFRAPLLEEDKCRSCAVR